MSFLNLVIHGEGIELVSALGGEHFAGMPMVADRRDVSRGQKSRKFADVLDGWPLRFLTCWIKVA